MAIILTLAYLLAVFAASSISPAAGVAVLIGGPLAVGTVGAILLRTKREPYPTGTETSVAAPAIAVASCAQAAGCAGGAKCGSVPNKGIPKNCPDYVPAKAVA